MFSVSFFHLPLLCLYSLLHLLHTPSLLSRSSHQSPLSSSLSFHSFNRPPLLFCPWLPPYPSVSSFSFHLCPLISCHDSPLCYALYYNHPFIPLDLLPMHLTFVKYTLQLQSFAEGKIVDTHPLSQPGSSTVMQNCDQVMSEKRLLYKVVQSGRTIGSSCSTGSLPTETFTSLKTYHPNILYVQMGSFFLCIYFNSTTFKGKYHTLLNLT